MCKYCNILYCVRLILMWEGQGKDPLSLQLHGKCLSPFLRIMCKLHFVSSRVYILFKYLSNDIFTFIFRLVKSHGHAETGVLLPRRRQTTADAPVTKNQSHSSPTRLMRSPYQNPNYTSPRYVHVMYNVHVHCTCFCQSYLVIFSK